MTPSLRYSIKPGNSRRQNTMHMENRQHLTPEEKCRFLILKSGIYFINFQEYESAVSIAREAAILAARHNITGKPLVAIYSMLTRSYLQLDADEKNLQLSDDFLNDINNKLIDSSSLEIPHGLLRLLYMKEENYQKAWYHIQKTGQPLKNFSPITVKLLLGMDSIPQLLAYLQKQRANLDLSLQKTTPAQREATQQIFLYEISYSEARAYLQAGDTNSYTQYLSEAISHFDRIPTDKKLKTTAIQEYADLLWKQGKHNEAIRRMEIVTRQLAKEKIFYDRQHPYAFKQTEQRLQRLQFLTGLYKQAGRPNDALRQAQLCDSIRNIYQKSHSKYEQDKNTARMYTAELQKNLNLRATELLREQHKLYIIALFLGITLLCLGALLLLYHRRKKQIDILYTRQKTIEQLQEEKQQTQSPATTVLSPEEELFSQLEKQFYGKQLFRNPAFSRDDLCRLGGSNRMYISTCINKYTGGNINQWINKARIDYAIRLIRSGETNLQVIAETSGFSSTTTFFRNFKQFTKLTPTQYIQRTK